MEVGEEIKIKIDDKEDLATLIAFDKSIQSKEDLSKKIKKHLREYIENDVYLRNNLRGARKELKLTE